MWIKRIPSEYEFAALQSAVVLILGAAVGAAVLLPIAQVLSVVGLGH